MRHSTFVTGVVLAAGSSRRLGTPKQLLAYKGATILDATLDTVRQCGFDQVIVTVGSAAKQVEAVVNLVGCDVVESREFQAGCSASISAALYEVDERAEGVVLLLGDQPGIRVQTVEELVKRASPTRLGVCRYDDGRGHPFWFRRDMFSELVALHGDKAVWKIIESGRFEVTEVSVRGVVPRDVDTWDDYEALLQEVGEASDG